MASEKRFRVVLPTQLVKGDNENEWKIMGLASTQGRDLQGEVIDQNGLDLTPIDMKKGIFNWDHKKGPENTIGVIDSYKRDKTGLFLSGRLFKNHSKAKAVFEIMSSLNKGDTGRMGMSVEGVIKERAGTDGKVIKRAIIHSCALTMNPVNVDTYANLVKSFADPDADLEFAKDEEVSPVDAAESTEDTADQPMFSANQVMAILSKALSTGSGAAGAPDAKTGGDALGQEELDRKKKSVDKALEMPAAMTGSDKVKLPKDSIEDVEDKKSAKKIDGHVIDNGGTENGMQKSLKKLSFALYKSHMFTLLNDLQGLYPEYTRSEIWEAVKDRLERKFPELKDWEN